MKLFKCIILAGVVTGINVATSVFAESAPVFDADSMQQQFESEAVAEPTPQPDVMPPDNAFVPAQTSPATAAVSVSGGSVEQRLRRAEQQINNLQNSESTAHIESLQDQVKALRGQVEELSHQLQQLQNQQKSIYSDLDKRLVNQTQTKSQKKAAAGLIADMEENAPPAKAPKISATKQSAKATVGADTTTLETKKSLDSQQPNVAEEQQIYQTAYNLIKAKKYNEAVDALQGMLKKYPSGQFASNAHYWLGELYGLMGKNDLALDEFGTVVSTYPESPRVSDAQLKIGLIYSTESKWSEAKTSFKKVINRYPGTASAHVASEQLKQIKTAGH